MVADEALMLAVIGAGATLLLIVTVFGVIWPRFMAWAAHFMTVVTCSAIIAALAYGWVQYRDLRSDLRIMRARLVGDADGLSATERQRYQKLIEQSKRDPSN